MMKKIVGCSLFLYSVASYAIFCPNNLNQINMGDSLDQVQQQCGKADSQKTYNKLSNVPQEWNYYPSVKPAAINMSSSGSIKLSVAFDTAKVVNISLDGVSIPKTEICGTLIAVGNTPEQVQNACGKPAMVNQSQGSEPTSIAVTELSYGSATLVFEGGVLKERK